MFYFTVYDAQTDRVLAFGSGRDCAQMLGVRLDTFRKMLWRSQLGKYHKYEFVKERVGREEYNNE